MLLSKHTHNRKYLRILPEGWNFKNKKFFRWCQNWRGRSKPTDRQHLHQKPRR